MASFPASSDVFVKPAPPTRRRARGRIREPTAYRRYTVHENVRWPTRDGLRRPTADCEGPRGIHHAVRHRRAATQTAAAATEPYSTTTSQHGTIHSPVASRTWNAT